MIEQERENGKFASKGNENRTVRSIRATDSTWSALEEKANEQDMSKADYLEALVGGEIDWESEDLEKDEVSELDFDVKEIAEILREALTLKSNAGGKIKTEIKRVLEMIGFEVEDK